MDATEDINAGLWAALTDDAALYAALGSQPTEQSKGVWNTEAAEDAPLPFVTFRLLTPTYDYTFGGVSSESYPYIVCAFAEDTGGDSGAETVALLTSHIRRILTDAEFAVTDYELLLCRPSTGLPADSKEAEGDIPPYRQGVLLEVLITPV